MIQDLMVNVIKHLKDFIKLGLVFSLLISCQPKINTIQPIVSLVPSERNIASLQSAFPKLTEEELKEDFGKELKIALTFAKEFDLYRAITSYKRALVLIPKESHPRMLQIEYSILECYYFGGKYQEVIETFEKSHLMNVKPDFQAFTQLLTILYDSYDQLGLHDKACRILKVIEKGNGELALRLNKYKAIKEADFIALNSMDLKEEFLIPYELETKSVRKAKLLNAILPGAGYYYIGQKKSAITAFIVNSLFTLASYQFFQKGYIAAGAITASFEAGWYLGAINGAGLEASEYNERLYEVRARDYLTREGLFPILSFETAF